MGILAQLRNFDPTQLQGRTDFDDLPATIPPKRRPYEMSRIVDATADERSMAAQVRAARRGPGAGMTDYANMRTDPCPIIIDAPDDARTPRQVELMDSLIDQLRDLDTDTADKARTYTDGMTAHAKWTAGRDGNASAWISRMITKVRELRNVPKVYPVGDMDAAFQDIPNGYYAVTDAGPDDLHFFRISRFRDGGIKVQEQASDTLHPVRRGSRRTAILTTIQTVGWRSAQELYGQMIGRCGRCNRTLTDAVSRSRGIGPDCLGKM